MNEVHGAWFAFEDRSRILPVQQPEEEEFDEEERRRAKRRRAKTMRARTSRTRTRRARTRGRARRSTTVVGTSFLLRRCANADADVADGCFCSVLLLGVLVQSLTRFRFYLTEVQICASASGSDLSKPMVDGS